MTVAELRQHFLEFFKEKGHAIIPSASILPENDPTTLFTGSGMQPMVPFLLGETHPLGLRIADSQKCFRAQDIDEVGDNRHTTFFEMLGNWSLGDYFKREQVAWMFEFLVKDVGLDPSRLYVTVFRGSEQWGIPRDEETAAIWQSQFAMAGIEAEAVDFAESKGMQGGRIFYYDEKKNWWSRSGTPEKMPVGEPGGPDTEMFWDFGEEHGLHAGSQWSDSPCHVNCDCGRFMEIGNNVFMEYMKTDDGFQKLAKQNVDFGGGLERIAAASINNPDVFMTDILAVIISSIENQSGKRYADGPEVQRTMRIIADHVRAAVFIIGDQRGVVPSNVGQGYVVRRLLRRAIRESRRLGIKEPCMHLIGSVVVGEFGTQYSELETNRELIIAELKKEEEKFGKTLEKGLKEFEKMMNDRVVGGKEAFDLFQTYGFPLELTQELVGERGGNLDIEQFKQEFVKHQELSRTASAGVFKGGLADHSTETTRLHTATHLLHRALKNVLGEHVEQKGSNITPERLRFDFSHPTKMTPEQIAAVEQMVNDAVAQDLPVRFEEMTVDEAKKRGAIGLFEDKYDAKIKVYFIGDTTKDFSKEICGGPHVTRTGEVGTFTIQKEEAVSAGVRRIKATVSLPVSE